MCTPAFSMLFEGDLEILLPKPIGSHGVPNLADTGV